MNKYGKVLALMLVVLMLGGCNLIGTDVALDAKTPVAKVGDEVITKSQFANNLYQLANMYSMYGIDVDFSNPDTFSQMANDTINQMITGKVTEQKARSSGFAEFTPEELTAIEETAKTNFDADFTSYKNYYFPDSTLPEEELRAQVEEKMTADGATMDSYIQQEKNVRATEKLRADTIKDVQVTEEEVKTAYDEALKAQQEKYQTDLTAYASDLNNGAEIYYVPAGYRFVKHVLIKFPQETADALNGLRSTLTGNQSNLAELQKQLDAIPEGEKAEERQALQTQLDAAQAAIAQTQEQLDRASEEAYTALTPKAQEILDKANLGLNFDKLIESYGEDPGMQSEPQKTQGYPVCAGLTTYDQAFQDASMALVKAGDVSGLVRSSFGYHIIQYVGDSVEGVQPAEHLMESLKASKLTSKQDEAYSLAQQTWAAETKIVTYEKEITSLMQ